MTLGVVDLASQALVKTVVSDAIADGEKDVQAGKRVTVVAVAVVPGEPDPRGRVRGRPPGERRAVDRRGRSGDIRRAGAGPGRLVLRDPVAEHLCRPRRVEAADRDVHVERGRG